MVLKRIYCKLSCGRNWVLIKSVHLYGQFWLDGTGRGPCIPSEVYLGEYLEEARRKSHLHNKTQLGLCAELIMSITET